MEITRILVPVDYSRHAEGALCYAGVLAERLHARIHVLHATTAPAHLSPDTAVSLVQGRAVVTVEALAREDAEAQMGPFLAAAGVSRANLTTEIAFDDPVDAIQARAGAHDLVILGTHGRRGLERWVMGSVAERVLRAVATPVITYRWPPEAAAPRPGVPRRILVPVDFSDGARAALALSGELRARFDAALDIVHVVREAPADPGGAALQVHAPGAAPEPLDAYARRQAEQEVEGFLASTPGHEGATVRVAVGEPGPTLVRLAAEGGHDLVVMGTHGRTGLQRLVLGSVAERVARFAPCPVLTLRHRGPGR